jgi:hypothetical protein
MSLIIKHRINRIADLENVDPSWGVEIDLRSNVAQHKSLHLSHDPWAQGDDFVQWLQVFSARKMSGPIILNTKEDALEQTIVELLERFQLHNWFFLDTALPTLVKWTQKIGEKRFAVRYSCYEKGDAIVPFIGKADWVWVDCFDGIPVETTEVHRLSKDFKVCLVSPELQGRPVSDILNFKMLLPDAHAVCTKQPAEWLKMGA